MFEWYFLQNTLMIGLMIWLISLKSNKIANRFSVSSKAQDILYANDAPLYTHSKLYRYIFMKLTYNIFSTSALKYEGILNKGI